MGRFEEAKAELKALETHNDSGLQPFTMATRGMYMLLTGEVDAGLQKYEEALDAFQKAKLDEQVTTCLAFMARSAKVARIEQASAVIQRAAERFKKYPSQAAAVVLRNLEQDVVNVESAPLRKVVQWEWDPSSNTLTEKRELTRRGAPSFTVSAKKSLPRK